MPSAFNAPLCRRLHLLARRRVADAPRQHQMLGVLLAAPGRAGLVERVEFHDAAGAISIIAIFNREPEILTAYACDAALLPGRQIVIARLPGAFLLKIENFSRDGIQPGLQRRAILVAGVSRAAIVTGM